MLGAIGSAIAGKVLGGGGISSLLKGDLIKGLLGGDNPLLNLLKNFLSQQNNGANAKGLSNALQDILSGEKSGGLAEVAKGFVKNAL